MSLTIEQAFQVNSGESSSSGSTDANTPDTDRDAVRDYLEATGDSVDGLENTPDASQLTAADFAPFDFEVVTVNEIGEEISRETKRAQVFREAIGNTFLEMIAISGGEFMMGQTESEKEELIRLVSEDSYPRLHANELPQHSVTVPQFLMGKYQVTQAQWKAVAALPKVNYDLEADPAEFKGDNRPVERVGWDCAVEFCQRLSQQTGREYRLPSEAEWEYACRAGTTTPFHFGPTITADLANYSSTEAYGSGPQGGFRQQTTEVGNFPPNAFGLHDMHGNVQEWCLDYWHDSYEGAPTDGSAWLSSDNSILRLLRGGAWVNVPRACRSAHRFNGPTRSTYHGSGFRVVCASSWALS